MPKLIVLLILFILTSVASFASTQNKTKHIPIIKISEKICTDIQKNDTIIIDLTLHSKIRKTDFNKKNY